MVLRFRPLPQTHPTYRTDKTCSPYGVILNEVKDLALAIGATAASSLFV